MAELNYYRKYYKSIVSQGHTWRVDILQQADYALAESEIGSVLQGLRLYVQGSQADIDTPIVKTSLEMVFVDAPDLDGGKKCGNWEEFYTSNATEYKVCLYKDDTLEWTGYITPDSFSEDLQYRGSVSIVARDNLGALQDFEYDLQGDIVGLVTLRQLITSAMDAIHFPMEYRVKTLTMPMCYEDTTSSTLQQVRFNSKAFIGKTWQNVLDGALSSVGLVMRYIGGNKYVITSLRGLPLYGEDYWDKVPVKEVRFSSFGHRELFPAVKKIIDEITYDIQENLVEVTMPEKAYGETSLIRTADDVTIIPNEYDVPVFALNGGTWESRSAEESLYFNPFAYPLNKDHSSQKVGDLLDTSLAYIVANDKARGGSVRSAEWRHELGAGKYHFSFTAKTPVGLYDYYAETPTTMGFIDIEQKLNSIKYYLRYEGADGVNYHYNATTQKWEKASESILNNVQQTLQTLFPVNFDFPVLEVETRGTLVLKILYLSVYKRSLNLDNPTAVGAYVPIGDILLEDAMLGEEQILTKQKIITKYKDTNNILIKRSPEYGFNPTKVSTPNTILNGISIKVGDWYSSSDQWAFLYVKEKKQLSALIHQQLLAYSAKPNNVLTGELAITNPDFCSHYLWGGKKHIITSGTLNILTGRMENVTLREFMRYDHMWETYADRDYVEVDAAQQPLILRVNSIKDLTFSDITIDDWIYLDSLSHEGDGLYELQISVARNDTGERRSGSIIIDTAAITIVQEA